MKQSQDALDSTAEKSRNSNMRYVLSVARHYLTGKLKGKYAAYALRERPVAVASKGKTWVIDPDFTG